MTVTFDPGSFKDPEGRVFLVDGRVYRTLSPSAAERMRELIAAGVIGRFVADGLLARSELAQSNLLGLDEAAFGATLMHHERIAPMSYPFEWSFEMLRDAALNTLLLLERCLEHDLILKDATAYNLAPHRGAMVFFDTLSIDRYANGAPWDGYAQFCREFLFPLMLTAYRGIDFHAWYRGNMDGIGLSDMSRMFGKLDILKPGVLRHVFLQRSLEKSFANRDVKIRSRFDKSVFSKDMILVNLRNLRRLIERLRYRPGQSEWNTYAESNSYSDHDSRLKAAFIESAMGRLPGASVVDLGCNTGHYSLIAAKRAQSVIAVDIDAACIDVLYRRIKVGSVRNVVPLVGNLLNPTPGLGWNLNQRRPLPERLRSDSFLALALIHHLRIGGNVPLDYCVDQLRQIAPAGVIEWVDRTDGMVRQMLRNRADVFDDYHWNRFESLVRERFTLAGIAESHGGARKLCLLLPKS